MITTTTAAAPIPTPEETATLVAELYAAVERSRQARGATKRCTQR
jgi:hypothetical protein